MRACPILLSNVQISEIQSRLLDLGSYVATPSTSSDRVQKRVDFQAENVVLLEEWIDELDEYLPPLSNFILPSGEFQASLATACGKYLEHG